MSKVEVPQKVLEGIMAVRDSGLTNMLDRPVVARLAERMGFDEAAQWVRSEPRTYAEGVFRGFAPQEEQVP